MIVPNFLIPPRGGDAARQPTTPEVLAAEIAADDPIEGAKRDVIHLMNEATAPEAIVSILMIRNTGLRAMDAIQIVNEIAGTSIDAATFKFNINAIYLSTSDVSPEIRKDPRAERLLLARREAERYLAESMTLESVTLTILLRNNITRSEAQSIIADLTKQP